MLINFDIHVLNLMGVKYASKHKANSFHSVDPLLIIIDTDLNRIHTLDDLNDEVGNFIINYFGIPLKVVDRKIMIDNCEEDIMIGNLILSRDKFHQAHYKLEDINKNDYPCLILYNMYFRAKMFGKIILGV